MLRSLLFSLAIIGSSSTVFSQPILTQTNVGYNNGDEIYYYITPGPDAGSSGPAQNWDFSAIKYSGTFTGMINGCAISPNCYRYPQSNTVSNVAPQHVEYFFDQNTDSITVNGMYYSGSSAPVEIYSDPQILLKFPFTYGNKYVDSFTSIRTSPKSTLTRTGSDSTEADGWGSITIKAGTASNALRIRKIMTYQDTYDTGAGPKVVFHFKIVNYLWYLPGYHEYLFSTATTTTDAFGVPPVSKEGRYTGMAKGIPTSVGSSMQELSNLVNPVKDVLHFQVKSRAGASVDCSITDAAGKRLRECRRIASADILRIDLPINDLARGLYILNISGSEGKVSRRFVVE